MQITGTSTLTADREAVWAALNDPAVLVRTIPGCRRLEALGDDAYKMTVAAGVGSIKGVYDGEVRLSEQQPPGSFRMRANGAGAPGTIGTDVRVTLTEGPDGGTSVRYEADATVGGAVGGVGQRMLVGVSKRMAGEFFAAVDAVLGGGTTAGVPSGVPEEPVSKGGEPASVRPDAHAVAPAAGSVWEAPAAGGGRGGFGLGVAAGAAAALVGALVGGWIAGRRRG